MVARRAVLLDDEPLALEHLRRKLQKLWPELEIVGEACNGVDGLALIQSEQPEIVFLDIRMPGLSGLQVAEAMPSACQVVFVTAYDQYALQAFDREAIDYLLKPVSNKRLLQTMAKLKRGETTELVGIQSWLKKIDRQSNYLVWLRTGLDDTTKLLAVEQVVFFRAEHKYTSVFTANQEHLIRMPLKALEAKLDPDVFWRIHRSVIVRVDQIASAKRDVRGRYTLTLRQRAESLRCSQAYGHLFKHM